MAPAKTILFTTGVEAVENAVRSRAPQQVTTAVISFSGLHGRTALTSDDWQGRAMATVRPSAADVFHAPFPLARYGVDVETSLLVLNHIRADVRPHAWRRSC